MNQPLRDTLARALCAAAATILAGCGGPAPTTTFVAAPPGPAEMGPATGLSTAPPEAVVFDLKYRPETGSADDLSYRSYYGGTDSETKTNTFLRDVRKKASSLYYVCNYALTGRKWAAVEYHGRQACALYFDVNADGKLSENERILPTRKANEGVEFITPDFMQPAEGGGQYLCRVLLQATFYGGSDEPSCMWSPAALMQSAATLDGQPAQLMLYANEPAGEFDKYGRSCYSLWLGNRAKPKPGAYVPRETLSSLIASEGRFYHLTVQGRYSNGLPARVVLEKDTTPTGALAVKLASSNALQATFTWLDLHGAEDKTIFLSVGASKGKVTLPVGSYVLDRGLLTYGTASPQDWEVSFKEGPRATVEASETFEQTLGQPTLRVRAINEQDRYKTKAAEAATFKRGTRIYLEPRIVGQAKEVFSRFRQGTQANGRKTDRAPRITITRLDGKEMLSKVMEYG